MTHVLSQRKKQLREKIETLKDKISTAEEKMRMIERQFLELADIHDFRWISPVESLSLVPDKVETDRARRYRWYAIACVVVGVIGCMGLAVLSFEFLPPVWLSALAALTCVLLSLIVVGIVWKTTKSDPRNPAAEAALRIWVLIWGSILLSSLILFGYLRFVRQDSLLSVAILGFEVSAFVLGGLFECGRHIFTWSEDLSRSYQQLRHQRDVRQMEKNIAEIELDEIQLGRIAEAPAVEVHT